MELNIFYLDYSALSPCVSTVIVQKLKSQQQPVPLPSYSVKTTKIEELKNIDWDALEDLFKDNEND
ncbi:hypothetical protein LZ575_10475 [Antarcticibacterium sp. 1MA-6-2]|uniref:hypothetical protein n=1 Tax=Antarcticibacterium sp. 1MA-6-2 TaxID=2908210 RepID=UPI001F34912D|nr:hypothetical protein [Antarcticibacterium sp. 1MA-6-2]UJH92804.1 hypothetical protein LZ575_10475 [Antarcticibacterium sp. 1MA-6-2]